MHKRSDETRKQFYLTTGKLEQIGDVFHLQLEDDPVIGISRADRKTVSDPNGDFAKKNFWRWAAGGVLIIYEKAGQKFLALLLKDAESPSFGGHITLTSGLSCCYEEFFNPTLVAVREGIEEVAVVINDRVIVPSLGPAFEEIAWNVFEKQLTRANKFDWLKISEDPLYMEAEFVEADEQELEVAHGKRVSRHQGIICLDPKTRGIDLLKIIQVNLPAEAEIAFFDCEDTTNGPLDREIFIFPLEQIKMLKMENAALKISGATLRFKSGKSTPVNPETYFPCTPPLEIALKSLLP